MDKVFDDMLKLIEQFSHAPVIWHNFRKEPNLQNCERLIEIMENCEKIFLTTKENIVNIVNEMNENHNKEIDEIEVDVEETTNGLKIKTIKE